MDKIQSAKRRRVLIKAGALALLPIPAMLLMVIIGLIGKPYCLFAPDSGGYYSMYILENIFPSASEAEQTVAVNYEGQTRVSSGATVLWEGLVYPDGMHRLGDTAKRPYYTLFWVPVYFQGFPMMREAWVQDLSRSSLVDLTGFLGPAGATYNIAIRNEDGQWYNAQWEDTKIGEAAPRALAIRGVNPLLREWGDIIKSGESTREIYFLGAGHSIAGRASYNATNGLMVYAVSFAQNGVSLTLGNDNMPRQKFTSLLLPFILVVAVGLAFWEVFGSSVKAEREGKGLPLETEFAIVGYTAILVDLYYDFVFFTQGSDLITILLHLALTVLIWYRFSWWALLPAMEVVIALISWLALGSLQPAFSFFPAATGAWLLALLIEGRLTPGKWPKALTPKSRE
jgi:hypothetical protein